MNQMESEVKAILAAVDARLNQLEPDARDWRIISRQLLDASRLAHKLSNINSTQN